ncbi:MAG TPA: NAD/FAD-binding protein, partial [Quisquiliibacterium sp.]|nr:NAD/FAD-binding protein [Quisquiliibacterium sp.]
EATAMARESESKAVAALDEPLGAWLRRQRYSDAFRDAYLLPMAAAIWSCPMKTMLGFPLGSFVRFFHNHGLLQIEDRPQWYTVLGGGREYVRRITDAVGDVRTGARVLAVLREPSGAGVHLVTAAGTERFDQVVFATHSTQTLAMLDDADAEERALLGAIAYQPNRAWLHTDARLMPRRRKAWAAWNYLGNGDPASPEVSVTYWLNRLQPLPFTSDVLLSLNPLSEPAPDKTIAVFDYEHPVFDRAAVAAQKRLPSIQGRRGAWYAGAWTGYGFHEDGLRSGLEVAARILELDVDAARRVAA